MTAPPKIGAILSSIDRPEIKVRVLSVRKAPRRSHYKLRVEVVVGDKSALFAVREQFDTIGTCWVSAENC
jgi:hypothetical protein